jgi:hypothetical protein
MVEHLNQSVPTIDVITSFQFMVRAAMLANVNILQKTKLMTSQTGSSILVSSRLFFY